VRPRLLAGPDFAVGVFGGEVDQLVDLRFGERNERGLTNEVLGRGGHPFGQNPRRERRQAQQRERNDPVADERQRRLCVQDRRVALHNGGDRRGHRHACERGDPDPGQQRGDPTEELALDDLFWLADFGELPHKRLADQHARQRNEEDSGVAQRLNPPLHERLTQRESQDGQHQKRCDSADFECAPRRSSDAPNCERKHGDREGDQNGGVEGDVTDENPIDDPRREAQHNAHEGSV
jgi:hypothetical protein